MSFRKSFLATTSLGAGMLLAALASPVLAADQGAPAQQPASQVPPAAQKPPAASTESTAVTEIVVTGSLIKASNFKSPAPIDVITADQSNLVGNVDTSQILQLSPVAANAEQINNFYTGLVGFAGGAGANTLSLRGLGSDRTLILLNGERMGPAGVSGEVGPVDLNTIPSSLIDHIEILKDGASSIYGSDAVAGVVNIITKTTTDGLELHAFTGVSQEGGANSYQLNGTWGKTFDKGYIATSFDYYRQDALLSGSRSYLDCSQDLVKDATTGQSADIADPNTGQDKCFGQFYQGNNIVNSIEDLGLSIFSGIPNAYVANPAAVNGGGAFGLDLPGFQAAGLEICTGGVLCPPGATTGIDTAATRASLAIVPFNASVWNKTTAISPVSRYTFSLFGGYDLTPTAKLYTSFMFNQRDSEQVAPSQFFSVVNPANPFNPGFEIPEPIIPQLEPSTQAVSYFRDVIGVKGSLPNIGTLTNWTYDLFGQVSYSDGTYTQVYNKNDRINATAGAGAGTGCDVNGFIPFGVGTGETMAQAEPGVACVPVNFFQAVIDGGFTPAETAFLYSEETGRTTYLQEYVQGSVTGDLFSLPAGPLQAAAGVHLRRESLDDNPGADFINQNVYNETTSGITKGSEDIEEVFGELQIPVLRDLPLVNALNLDVSGRYSHYSSFGGNFTYKGTADWKITDWFEVRGTYGTAFRAPALFELFLADETGFEFVPDPCVDYATSGVSATVQKNCASQGIPGNFAGSLESSTIEQGGGAGHLKPETSDAETIGFVLTPNVWDTNINLAVDYYDYDIDNQIALFGPGNILAQCYGSPTFPNSPFCSLFQRDTNPSDPNYQGITVVNNDYVNIAKQIDQGMDVDLQASRTFRDSWKVTLEANLDWTFYNNTFLLGGVTNNYLGTIGEPRFVGNTDVRLDHGDWTFNYLIYMVGAVSDDPIVATVLPNFRGTGETVVANYSIPFYTTSTISVRRKFDKFVVEAGIKNVFNKTPPLISGGDPDEVRQGNAIGADSQYDLIGRQFYFDIDAKF
jgi:iron complex outermembrane receptor protein